MPKNRISPHDRYIKALMTHPEANREFFEAHLPSRIKEIADLSSLQLQRDSFVDDKLRLQIADLLYSVKINGKEGFFYLLLEHQSSPDKLLPFRLLKYMLAIMEQHMKKTGTQKLPFVYPLVLFTGDRPYPYTMNLFDLFEEQSLLAEETLLAPYQLIDLTQLPDEKLMQYLWFGTAAFIAKHIHDPDITPSFKKVVKRLKILDETGGFSYICTMISYMFEAGEVANTEELFAAIRSLGSKEEDKLMTIAEQLRQEGFEKGIHQGLEKGIHQGKVEAAHDIALNFLKLGIAQEQIAQATGLALEEIENLKKQIH
jgi:predicted transposase/invertase (TIGR01784 family)